MACDAAGAQAPAPLTLERISFMHEDSTFTILTGHQVAYERGLAAAGSTTWSRCLSRISAMRAAPGAPRSGDRDRRPTPVSIVRPRRSAGRRWRIQPSVAPDAVPAAQRRWYGSHPDKARAPPPCSAPPSRHPTAPRHGPDHGPLRPHRLTPAAVAAARSPAWLAMRTYFVSPQAPREGGVPVPIAEFHYFIEVTSRRAIVKTCGSAPVMTAGGRAAEPRSRV